MKTTYIDGKPVIVEGPHDSTTSQGTQEAQGKKRKPLFCPRKQRKSTTSYPKVHLTMKKRKKGSEDFEEEPMEKDAPQKKASIEEECFEVEATEKDAAQNKASIKEEGSEEEKMDANLTAWDTAFFGSVQEKEYSYEEENDDADVVDSAKSKNQPNQ